MPIYAYKCDACGHAKDVLQKMSDDALTDCPVCGAPKFSKQLTAPGFQLKGTGWYATDFKGGAGAAAATTAATTDAVATPASGADAPVTAPSTNAVAGAGTGVAASAGAGGCATSCACH